MVITEHTQAVGSTGNVRGRQEEAPCLAPLVIACEGDVLDARLLDIQGLAHNLQRILPLREHLYKEPRTGRIKPQTRPHMLSTAMVTSGNALMNTQTGATCAPYGRAANRTVLCHAGLCTSSARARDALPGF